MMAWSTVLTCILMPLSAGFSWRLDLLSMEPLHKEYLADRDSAALQINYMDIYEGFPDHVFQDGRSWDDWKWDPTRFDFDPGSRLMTEGTWAAQIKLGENLSLFRNTFTFDHWLSPISFDITFSGIMDILMEGAFADMIAYDGAYFYGLTMAVGDFFSMRTGFHHICTHYGDAVMKAIPRSKEPTVDRSVSPLEDARYVPRDDFNVTYKYVRMNGAVLGLSIHPFDCLRLYGEFNFVPKSISSLRPVMFQPSWVDISRNGETYPDEYGSRIINFGIELSCPIFRSLGKTSIGYDCHMYEEGKIVYRHGDGSYFEEEDRYFYDPDGPWIMDHGLVLEQELTDTLSVEIGWHTGRSPLHAFWFIEKPSWFYIGVRFDPDPTVKIWESGKR